MKRVQLGRTDLRASRLGCGCSQIASLTTRHSHREIEHVLLSAYEQGINFFDTADVYGQGDSERLLGKLFHSRRDQVILCTKAGLSVGPLQPLVRAVKPVLHPLFRQFAGLRGSAGRVRRHAEGQCFRPDHLRTQVEASLRRLRTDYLDLFLLHSPPVVIANDDQVFKMLARLCREGLIRNIGVSCNTAAEAERFLARDDVSCLQLPVNLNEREMLAEILPRANQKGTGVISREPFDGQTLLSSRRLAEFCATRPGFSPARVALQFLLQNENTGVVLVGMTGREHLFENLDVLAAQALSEADLLALESEVPGRLDS